MQSADRLILGGFNEGNWPPRPEVDPWTNAEMRRTAGLQPHNWRTGLSAHDVWMASCAPEVIITRALRDGAAVPTPSRWRQRFDAVAAALSACGGDKRSRLCVLGTGVQERDSQHSSSAQQRSGAPVPPPSAPRHRPRPRVPPNTIGRGSASLM